LQALKAAIKAIFINKIGDLCFLIGCGLFISVFITLDFEILLFSSIFKFQELIICVFFLVAIAAKSAQIGLHT
jgi:NADH:ubiquinone oxidoreductase subunit 5 (subunit L)/multisubunit Na+/H+ antiporter MnhA subunit